MIRKWRNQKEIPTPQNFKLIGQAHWSRKRAATFLKLWTTTDDDGGRTPDHAYIISSL